MISSSLLLIYSILSVSVKAAPASWLQEPDAPAAQLFKRQSSATVGTPEWVAQYPPINTTPPPSSLPKAWTDRLAQVVASPQWPTFGPSNLNNGYPLYNNGFKGTDQAVCSFTYQCNTAEDWFNGPSGTISLAFDDGPVDVGNDLYTFMEQNNVSATHFLIGSNIVNNPTVFQRAVADNGNLAVHTWSHPYMTPLSNEGVLAELGWTMQIIYDSSGGRVPKYWRPPYGDVDNRVRAIAAGVFGLTTVVWNNDTGDWAIGSDPNYTFQSVTSQFTQWLEGPKYPGLNILEHERSNWTVAVFEAMFPVMKKNGWNVMNVAQAAGTDYYQNAKDNKDTPTADTIVTTGDIKIYGSVPPGYGNTTTTTSSSAAVSSSASSAAPSSTASASATSLPSSGSSLTNGSASASAASASATRASGAEVRSSMGGLVVGGALGAVGVILGMFMT